MDNRLRKPTKEVFQIRYIHGTEFNTYDTSKYGLKISPNEFWVYITDKANEHKIVNRIPVTSILEIKTKMI